MAVVVVPNKVVTIRRWEIVAAFIFVIAAAAGSVQWSNHNIDKKVDANAVSIEDLEKVNVAQNEIRQELVAHFKEQDARFCMFINDLRAENRREALRDFNNLDRNLRLLGITKSAEIQALAEEELNRALARNQEADC